MSHFTVLVTGPNVEEALDPFDENTIVPRYVQYTREQAIAKSREDTKRYAEGLYAKYLADRPAYIARSSPEHITYLAEEFPKHLTWTDEEHYADFTKWYEADEIGPDGEVYSTYNPKSKWDWWVQGGRWDGGLVTHSGQQVNRARADEVNIEKSVLPTFAYLHNGEWKERGRMGWWAMVSEEKAEEKWREEFLAWFTSLPGDTLVTLVDAHI